MFYNVKHYNNEFSDYISAGEDAMSYYFQWCEIDARTYADSSVTDYYTKINAHLGKDASFPLM